MRPTSGFWLVTFLALGCSLDKDDRRSVGPAAEHSGKSYAIGGEGLPDSIRSFGLADVDGDGAADGCTRMFDGVSCVLANGTSASWTSAFSDAAGWNNDMYRSTLFLADVDGDDKADLCGRSANGFVCAASMGTRFAAPRQWDTYFSNSRGYSQAAFYSTIFGEDVDGDGMVDLCGKSAEADKLCFRSNGREFVRMPGTFGNAWQGDYLANLQVGAAFDYQVSFRFLATESRPVNQLTYFNTYSFTKTGYHKGDGGHILIEIRTDDGTSGHGPSSTVLATAEVAHPLDVTEFLRVDLSQKVNLQKNALYHVVFKNVHPDAKNNFVSVDCLMTGTANPAGAPEQPGASHLNFAALISYASGTGRSAWVPAKSEGRPMTPIFSLFLDGSLVVDGFGAIEAWSNEARPIHGANKVRQTFVAPRDQKVLSLAVRVAKIGMPKNLRVTLEGADGTVLETSEFAPDAIAPAIYRGSIMTGSSWVNFAFNVPRVLLAGREYRVVLSSLASDSNNHFKTFPLRDGSFAPRADAYPFSSTWLDGYAQYLADGETNWHGWDGKAWTAKDIRVGDLQVYFRTY